MKSKNSILYIQHAGTIGGSVVSLREVIQDALITGYSCTVVCPTEAVADIYRKIGARTYVSVISPWNHNTAYFYKCSIRDVLRTIKVCLKTVVSFIRLYSIVREVKPVIVHLNSSTLVLYSVYFSALGFPNILHIRETIVKGYFGFRKSIIRRLANKLTSAIIYISEFEKEVLATLPEKSYVIYNYVHLDSFRGSEGESGPMEVEKNGSKLTVLTLGGLFSLKGGAVILESLANIDDIELWVLGNNDPRSHADEIEEIEGKEYLDKLVGLLNDERIGRKVKFGGRIEKPVKYLKLADVLVFWAASPHFPRPVFEAWLLRKPVLYFNPGYENDLINAETVRVIGGRAALDLSIAIKELKDSQTIKSSFLEKTYKLAEANFTERNFSKIDALYRMCLKNHS